MPTEFTAITIIVVRASVQASAEAAAIAADPQGGAGTFANGVPLRSAGGPNTPVAYWCRWNMKPQQRAAFASNLGGPLNVLAVGQQPNMSRDAWMFDAAEGQWTPAAVLAALGFDTYALVRPD